MHFLFSLLIIVGALRHLESNALAGSGGGAEVRISTSRSGKSSGSNKGSDAADTARPHTARSMQRHDSPLVSGHDTGRGIKKALTPSQSIGDLAGEQ